MSVLSVRQIKADFYAVLKTGSAGTATRAALGAGATSVLTREQLRLALPLAPFIALSFGAFTGAIGFVRTLYPTWWLYDDAPQGWYRLNGLAALIEAAYPEDALTYCYTNYAGGIGDEITDTALMRPALALRYQVKGRF